MPQVKRVVIGVGPDKKSTVLHRESPNHQEVPFGARQNCPTFAFQK